MPVSGCAQSRFRENERRGRLHDRGARQHLALPRQALHGIATPRPASPGLAAPCYAGLALPNRTGANVMLYEFERTV
jgi:hypothetical protein